jgi:hypothetical protein
MQPLARHDYLYLRPNRHVCLCCAAFEYEYIHYHVPIRSKNVAQTFAALVLVPKHPPGLADGPAIEPQGQAPWTGLPCYLGFKISIRVHCYRRPRSDRHGHITFIQVPVHGWRAELISFDNHISQLGSTPKRCCNAIKPGWGYWWLTGSVAEASQARLISF